MGELSSQGKPLMGSGHTASNLAPGRSEYFKWKEFEKPAEVGRPH